LPSLTNTMIFGTREPTTMRDILHNLGLAHELLTEQVAATAVGNAPRPASVQLPVEGLHGRPDSRSFSPMPPETDPPEPGCY
jgi:hypothetical protein